MASPPAVDLCAVGTVVVRMAPGGPQVLLVHRAQYGDWSLPKGTPRPGELLPVAAARGTREETGFPVRLGPPAGTVRYPVEGRQKEVSYWRGTVTGAQGRRSGDEVDASEWFDLDAALAALTYENERAITLAAARQQHTVPLVIARHTTARSRGEWRAADPDRPLEERGNDQALRLAGLLSAWAPQRVLSSPSRRCIESITPYAAAVATTVEVEPVLSEEGHEQDPGAVIRLVAGVLAELRHEVAGARPSDDDTVVPAVGAVVCTHRPVLPTVADTLGVPLAADDRAEALPPGGCWVLHLGADGPPIVERHAV